MWSLLLNMRHVVRVLGRGANARAQGCAQGHAPALSHRVASCGVTWHAAGDIMALSNMYIYIYILYIQTDIYIYIYTYICIQTDRYVYILAAITDVGCWRNTVEISNSINLYRSVFHTYTPVNRGP